LAPSIKTSFPAISQIIFVSSISNIKESKKITHNHIFKFIPKAGTSAAPFSIQVDDFLRPKNLIYPYKFTEGTGDAVIQLSVKA